MFEFIRPWFSGRPPYYRMVLEDGTELTLSRTTERRLYGHPSWILTHHPQRDGSLSAERKHRYLDQTGMDQVIQMTPEVALAFLYEGASKDRPRPLCL